MPHGSSKAADKYNNNPAECKSTNTLSRQPSEKEKNKTQNYIYSLSAEQFALTFDSNDSVKEKFLIFSECYFC